MTGLTFKIKRLLVKNFTVRPEPLDSGISSVILDTHKGIDLLVFRGVEALAFLQMKNVDHLYTFHAVLHRKDEDPSRYLRLLL